MREFSSLFYNLGSGDQIIEKKKRRRIQSAVPVMTCLGILAALVISSTIWASLSYQIQKLLHINFIKITDYKVSILFDLMPFGQNLKRWFIWTTKVYPCGAIGHSSQIFSLSNRDTFSVDAVMKFTDICGFELMLLIKLLGVGTNDQGWNPTLNHFSARFPPILLL